MQYRALGRTGVRVSPLVLGTANFGDATPEREAHRIVERALDTGVNLIDTADSYADGESERIVGRALERSGRRDEVVLATKAHYPVEPGPNDRGNSRLHLIRSCQASLERLRVDHVALFQLHRPDMEIPVDETLRALDDLVRWGMVRYAGVSTHPAWKVQEMVLTAEMKGLVRPISEQPPYNLLDRRIENELIPMCRANGLGVLCWSPMAMGVLAGRYDAAGLPPDSRAARRGGIYAERVTPEGIEVGRRFAALAADRGVTPAQLANLWVKDQPGVTAAILGPRSVAQIDELLPVLAMTLDDDIRAACDALVAPGTAVANFHNSAEWLSGGGAVA